MACAVDPPPSTCAHWVRKIDTAPTSWRVIQPVPKKKQRALLAPSVLRGGRRGLFAWLEVDEAAVKITRLVRRFLFRRRLTWITVTGSVSFSKEHLKFIEDSREKCGMDREMVTPVQRPSSQTAT